MYNAVLLFETVAYCAVDDDRNCSQLTLLSCNLPQALKRENPCMAASCFAAGVEAMQECRVLAHSKKFVRFASTLVACDRSGQVSSIRKQHCATA